MKKLSVLALVAMLFVACGGKSEKKSEDVLAAEVAAVEVAEPSPCEEVAADSLEVQAVESADKKREQAVADSLYAQVVARVEKHGEEVAADSLEVQAVESADKKREQAVADSLYAQVVARVEKHGEEVAVNPSNIQVKNTKKKAVELRYNYGFYGGFIVLDCSDDDDCVGHTWYSCTLQGNIESVTITYKSKNSREEAMYKGVRDEKEVYTYNRMGNILKELHYTCDSLYEYTTNDCDVKGNIIKSISGRYSNQWSQDTTLYKYDSKNRLISVASPSADGVINIIEEYKYDSRGNKIEEVEYRDDGTKVYTHIRKYNKQNKLIEHTWRYPYGEDSYVDSYKYDSRGKIVKAILNERESEDYRIDFQKFLCKYNSQGKEVARYTYNDDGKLSLYSTTKYDKKGRIIEKRIHPTILHSHKISYAYNEKSGVVVKRVSYDNRSEYNANNYKFGGIYKYDSKGELIGHEDSLPSIGGGRHESVSATRRDSKGRVIEKAQCGYYDAEIMQQFGSLSIYDAKGNELEYYGFINAGSLWYKIVNKYDKNGRKIESVTYFVDNADYNYEHIGKYDMAHLIAQFKKDAKAAKAKLKYAYRDTYKYDSHGNLVQHLHYEEDQQTPFGSLECQITYYK